ASGQHRLRMCELAIAGRPEFAVSEVDLERAPPSYTVDTIRTLHAAHPGDDLWLIVGADTLGDLPAWRDVAGILALVRLVAVTRPGYPSEPPPALVAAVPAAVNRIEFHAMSPIEIAASTVRDLAAHGAPLDAYLPPDVRDYVRAHRLYQG
ncbi:MAG: nicotinate-nicotinamide nucleotide adenylyltransferase, partial [Actinobacteria bacterium]|nr:nicotinate-nicotinamide nucleotide adenylyltransferase [Actinomycetota bacterium]